MGIGESLMGDSDDDGRALLEEALELEEDA